MSTCHIATSAREYDNLTTWIDVRAWTIGIMYPNDGLRNRYVMGTLDDTVS